MLNVQLRDVKVKGKVLRRKGFSTGTLRKKSGEVVPITILTHEIDTYLGRYGMNDTMELSLSGEKINSKLDRLQRDVLVYNVMNIDFFEI